MNKPALLPDVIETQTVPDPDPATLELAYRNDVYDPHRDIRNKYPMYAQQLVFNRELRAQYHEACEDVCAAGLFGYKKDDRDLAKVKTIGLKGFAMGMDFLRALETIKIIHGMPTIRGPQALHLVRERTRGATLECEESSDSRCVWLLGRPGATPKHFTGTREQVERANLPNKNSLWNVYPSRMLKWHTFSEGVQELFGDVLMGCYLSEEIHLEAQFDRDQTQIAEESERQRAKGTSRGNRRSKPKPQTPATTPESAGAPATPPEKPAPAPPAERKADPAPATQEQRQAIGSRITEMAKLTGARWPTEEMADDQRRLIEKEWKDARTAVWDTACGNALEGEIPSVKSMTEDQAKLLIAELDQAIARRSED